jgi:hypothetical protein
VPLCTKYDDLRCSRLIETIYPARVPAAAAAAKDERIKEQSVQEAIPELIRFNIAESEVRDVI